MYGENLDQIIYFCTMLFIKYQKLIHPAKIDLFPGIINVYKDNFLYTLYEKYKYLNDFDKHI